MRRYSPAHPWSVGADPRAGAVARGPRGVFARMERSGTIVHNQIIVVSIDEVQVPQAARSSSIWVGLGEASRLLGIAPGTLRRWADAGRVPVFTTPGGHRRFSRSTINALLPAARTRRPALARLGASPERMARAYHAVSYTHLRAHETRHDIVCRLLL